MRPPQMGFTLSSFGGLELSTVPYAYYWVNSTMHWLLEQVSYELHRNRPLYIVTNLPSSASSASSASPTPAVHDTEFHRT
jgi:hypothetical protein